MIEARPARWIALIISLPGRRGTARMRVWRALKAAGAAVLRDGVYLLPETPEARARLDKLAQVVRAAGGTARVLSVATAGPGEDREFRGLFERGPDYAHLLEAIQKQRAQLRRRRVPDAIRRVQALRRELEALRAIDYFPGPAREQVAEALAELETVVTSSGAASEPRPRPGAIERRDPKAFRSRTWATRARPWVDRLASAWLIKRFIDPKAKVLWLQDTKRCPKSALGFDFDGAAFSHVGARVTFETLLASFGLDDDSALLRIGRLVHCLDVGGAPVPEAQGLSAILAGARTRLTNDNRLLAEASRVFDHLYRSYQEE
jgi:hypothetical protein